MIKVNNFVLVTIVLFCVSCSNGNAEIMFEGCKVPIPHQFAKVKNGLAIEEYVFQEDMRIATVKLDFKNEKFEELMNSEDFSLMGTFHQEELKIDIYKLLIPHLQRELINISITKNNRQIIAQELKDEEIIMIFDNCLKATSIDKVFSILNDEFNL
jgi:hypothetical protein